MNYPLVSINIVTRNRAYLLKKAIKSVLNQNYKNFEVIIIDDDSKDKTREVVLSFNTDKIRYKKASKQKSLSDARNLGLNLSNGKYIAILDDDDEWIDNEKIKRQVNFLENNPEYSLIGTGAICVDENGKYLYKYLKPKTNQEIKKTILGYNCFIHSTVIFKKDAAIRVGLYSEKSINVNVSQDYNLFLKLGKSWKLYNLPHYSIKYTINKNSHGRKNIIKQLKTSIRLANKYKKYYPKNKRINLMKNYVRLFIYGYLRLYK